MHSFENSVKNLEEANLIYFKSLSFSEELV